MAKVTPHDMLSNPYVISCLLLSGGISSSGILSVNSMTGSISGTINSTKPLLASKQGEVARRKDFM